MFPCSGRDFSGCGSNKFSPYPQVVLFGGHKFFGKVLALLVQASPNDHMAAPSKTTSFKRNCPGRAESEGNPPRLGSHPGVENKKESVLRNMRTPTPIPS